MIEIQPFDSYQRIVLKNAELEVAVLTLGCTTQSIRFGGQERLLGYQDAKGYLKGEGYIGATVGRYANRIKNASYTYQDKTIQLVPNEGKNQLHGGPNAFDQKVWEYEIRNEYCVCFHLFSPDLENGYPGNLDAFVTYTLSGNQLKIEFTGQSDQDTIFGPTTHMYFDAKGKLFHTQLKINADAYCKVDEENIPLAICPVDETFDFRSMREIKQDYDHCFVLNGEEACVVETDDMRMQIKTDYPGLQLYTGAFLNGVFQPNDGFALEPEFFPDSPNQNDDAFLKANVLFHKYVTYTFEKK